MIASEQTATDFTLPTFELRSLLRRAALPLLLGGALVLALVSGGGRLHAVQEVLRRALGANGYWTAAAIVFECVSLAGYVVLLSLVAGRATRRVGLRESAQITFAGAAATRLLPTAGAGGAALTLWSFRRAGLGSARAARTLLSFLVLLYSVFLVAILLAGASLAFGLFSSHGPTALSAIPAAGAAAAITIALALAFGGSSGRLTSRLGGGRIGARARQGAELIGAGVRDGWGLVRSRDIRLLGAPVYWAFDAAVLWAMLGAFGARPSLAIVALAYFVGQVANTLPLPGSVSGGIAGVLIAFGVAPAVALPAVLAYRTIAVWLPVLVALGALSRLRSTIAGWSDDYAQPSGAEIFELDEQRVVHPQADRPSPVLAA